MRHFIRIIISIVAIVWMPTVLYSTSKKYKAVINKGVGLDDTVNIMLELTDDSICNIEFSEKVFDGMYWKWLKANVSGRYKLLTEQTLQFIPTDTFPNVNLMKKSKSLDKRFLTKKSLGQRIKSDSVLMIDSLVFTNVKYSYIDSAFTSLFYDALSRHLGHRPGNYVLRTNDGIWKVRFEKGRLILTKYNGLDKTRTYKYGVLNDDFSEKVHIGSMENKGNETDNGFITQKFENNDLIFLNLTSFYSHFLIGDHLFELDGPNPLENVSSEVIIKKDKYEYIIRFKGKTIKRLQFPHPNLEGNKKNYYRQAPAWLDGGYFTNRRIR